MNLKYLYYRAKFRLAPYLNLRGPVHLDLELNGTCQLACTMCPYSMSFESNPQNVMKYDTAIEVLAQARELGALSCKVQFRGEPGLSKILFPVIREAKKMGYVEVIMNTNLTAFSYRRLEQLSQSGLDLCIISIDGATKETYESIRVKGDFERLVGNITYLWSIPNRPRMRLQYVEQDANRHETELFKKTFKKYCDELVIQKVRDRGAGEGESGGRKACPQPFQRLVVMWDGQVGLCCSNWHTEAVVGHFPTESLAEIWSGERAKHLRRLAIDPRVGEPCKSCTVGSSYK